MTVREAIAARRSIRKYRDKDAAIPQEQIDMLLEAAMKAPTACNVRPWSFLVVRSREKLDAIAEAHPFGKMIYECPLAIIVLAQPVSPIRGAQGYFPQDCGAATQNILLQATELGLGTCWCAAYPSEMAMNRLRRALPGDIPPELVPFSIVAVGHSAEEPEPRGFYEKNKVIYI
jgi:nitroreductase